MAGVVLYRYGGSRLMRCGGLEGEGYPVHQALLS